ncbi:hypothetical protein MHBO_002723 [Bonamia ostreae]|uniref:Adenylosuccinate lyase PurB C-terminal domain-containing protein n=1 Tax=Bonamia ostreae TaxID=126728 RepID=A0ABV2AN92_9EUKA
MRNLGPSIAHSLIAFESLLNGLTKLNPNFVKIKKDLEDNWILLAEPIQSVMRMENIENSYEELKKLTRGKEVSKREIKNFIAKLDITSENKVLKKSKLEKIA